VTLNHFDMPHELDVRYVGWLGAGIRYNSHASSASSRSPCPAFAMRIFPETRRAVSVMQ
jgi:hypothetical protein